MKWDEMSPREEEAVAFAKRHINDDLSEKERVLLHQLSCYGSGRNYSRRGKRHHLAEEGKSASCCR